MKTPHSPDASGTPVAPTAPAGSAVRLQGAERSRAIAAEAARLFALQGFGASMRTLADRLGIPVSVLYRHFGDKQALVEQVFAETFLEPWAAAPERVLTDRAISLADRLRSFFVPYGRRICSSHWSRLFLHAGLSHPAMTRAYLEQVRDRAIVPMCLERRAAAGLRAVPATRLSVLELERAWAIHAKLIYLGTRCHVWSTRAAPPTAAAVDEVVALAIDAFMRAPPAASGRLQ